MYRKVAALVIFAHLTIGGALFSFSSTKDPKRDARLAVRTIQPHFSAPRVATTAMPPRIKKKLPQVATPPPLPPPQAKVKATPKATRPHVVKKKQEVAPEIWEKVNRSLAKIEAKGYSTPNIKLEVPRMQSLSATEMRVESAGDLSRSDQLTAFLHSALHLPEVGEVTVQLTVKKDGTILRVFVVRGESQKNQAYLQKNLPLLQLPLLLENETILTLTFCNET